MGRRRRALSSALQWRRFHLNPSPLAAAGSSLIASRSDNQFRCSSSINFHEEDSCGKDEWGRRRLCSSATPLLYRRFHSPPTVAGRSLVASPIGHQLRFSTSVKNNDEESDEWSTMLSLLKEYINSDDATKSKSRQKGLPPQLDEWIQKQLTAHLDGTLSSYELYQLQQQVGFPWDMQLPHKSQNKLRNFVFERLSEHVAKHGPSTKLPHALDEWVVKQTSTEDMEWIAKLVGLGLDLREASWDYLYSELRKFFEEHGHCRVTFKQNPRLHSWVANQRYLYKKDALPANQFKLLQDIDFLSPAHDAAWNKQYQALQKFVEEHGHANVPRSYGDGSLHSWIHQQWTFYRRVMRGEEVSATTQRWIERLKKFYKPPSPRSSWHVRYEELQEYSKRNGHVHVTFQENPSLYRWILQQRYLHRRNRLRDEQVQQLKEINFFFDPYEKQFRKQLEDYKKFVDDHGHDKVPHTSHQTLYRWQREQRFLYRYGHLSQKRIQALEDIGFTWKRAKWFSDFEPLYRFAMRDLQLETGLTRGKFKIWVTQQRRLYGHFAKLSKRIRKRLPLHISEHIDALNRVGFEWNEKKERK